jgi:uncharacterized protein (DUF433 family)
LKSLQEEIMALAVLFRTSGFGDPNKLVANGATPRGATSAGRKQTSNTKGRPRSLGIGIGIVALLKRHPNGVTVADARKAFPKLTPKQVRSGLYNGSYSGRYIQKGDRFFLKQSKPKVTMHTPAKKAAPKGGTEK